MRTTVIHELEVEQVRPLRPAALAPPRAELATAGFAPRIMFSDSLLEFGVQRKRKAWATTASFIFNCLAIATMLIVPLLFTEDLPKAQLLTFLVAPPPPPPPPPPAAAVERVVRRVQTDALSEGQLRTPSRIPQGSR